MSARAAVHGKTDNRMEKRSTEARPRASYFQELMGRHLPDLHSLLEEHNGKMNVRNNEAVKPKTSLKEPKTEGLVPTPREFERMSDLSWSA